MVGVKLDLEAWAEKFKVLASNRTDRDQLGSRRVCWGRAGDGDRALLARDMTGEHSWALLPMSPLACSSSPITQYMAPVSSPLGAHPP